MLGFKMWFTYMGVDIILTTSFINIKINSLKLNTIQTNYRYVFVTQWLINCSVAGFKIHIYFQISFIKLRRITDDDN